MQMKVLQDLALRIWQEYEWALSIAGLFSFIITNQSSGPGGTIGLLCVCLSARLCLKSNFDVNHI